MTSKPYDAALREQDRPRIRPPAGCAWPWGSAHGEDRPGEGTPGAPDCPSMTNPTKTRRRFTTQQKAETVELCLQEEGLSCNAVAEPLGLAAKPGKLVAGTSLGWLAALGITAAGIMAVLERQLELLLERTAPASPAP